MILCLLIHKSKFSSIFLVLGPFENATLMILRPLKMITETYHQASSCISISWQSFEGVTEMIKMSVRSFSLTLSFSSKTRKHTRHWCVSFFSKRLSYNTVQSFPWSKIFFLFFSKEIVLNFHFGEFHFIQWWVLLLYLTVFLMFSSRHFLENPTFHLALKVSFTTDYIPLHSN